MRAQDFVNKRPTKTLTIFDIDDTLFHTTAKIKVVKDGKVLRTLTNQEFNTYELEPGEEFDFGEFRDAKKFAKESEPIEHMMDELKTILDHSQGTVIMLTARADFDNKETFLKTFTDHGIDMSRIHVHRAGNLPGDAIPAEKKAVWVRRYLDTGKYNQVSLYDDSMSNLRVFKSLKKEYPDVDFDAYYITPNDVAAVEGRGKKRRRKPKYAYGAPWGWYGMDTGYSGDGGGDGGGMEEVRKLRRWSWSKPSRFSRLEDFDIEEASYPGNIGIMELAKFFKIATPEQEQMFKKLLANGEKKLAWFLIQKVTGVKLQGDEFNENFADGSDILYHATYRPLLKSIRSQGLGGSASQAKWEDSEPGVTYLARDPEVARSYAETSDMVPEEWLDDIVILAIDASRLDPRRLRRDRNVQDDNSTLEYHGVIKDFALTENFADGKNPGRKGLSKRMGVPTKASVSSLRKIAKNSSGEKQRMAHWLANMKSGKSK